MRTVEFNTIPPRELWRTAKLVSNLIDFEGGCSVSLRSQRPYDGDSGYAVSVYPECERILIMNHPVPILGWIQEHESTLLELDRYIGGWLNPESGNVHLDVSVIVEDKSLAMFLARSANQTAVYDIAGGHDIRVPGSASPVTEGDVS